MHEVLSRTSEQSVVRVDDLYSDRPWWLRPRPMSPCVGGFCDTHLNYMTCGSDVIIAVYELGPDPRIVSRYNTGKWYAGGHAVTVAWVHATAGGIPCFTHSC
jgi:hypothetical protein